MTTEYSKQYDPKLVAFVDKIAKMPSGPERWRAAINVWLLKNEVIQTPDGPMTARQYNQLQIEYNKQQRAQQENKFGANKEGTLRFGISIPEGAWQMVKLVDPLAFRVQTGMLEDVQRNFRLFMESFPEYRIAEKV